VECDVGEDGDDHLRQLLLLLHRLGGHQPIVEDTAQL
jgi:hypothetical protein